MDAVVVGGPESHFEDDIEISCACGAIVYIRPYTNKKGVPVICLKCFLEMVKADDVSEVVIPKKAIREARRYLNLTKGKRN